MHLGEEKYMGLYHCFPNCVKRGINGCFLKWSVVREVWKNTIYVIPLSENTMALRIQKF
jgi:hypothetical protein